MVGEFKPNPSMLDEADFREIIRRGKDLGRMIASIPKPVIGIARGGARGGGLELLLRSDFIYTLDEADFQFPEVQMACVTTWGGTQWAGRLVSFRRAQEMLLLSERVNGRQAEEIGLVHRSFATAEALEEHVASILQRLRFCSPDAFAGTKRSLAAIWETSLRESEPVESDEAARVMATHRFSKVWPMWGQGKRFDYYDEEFRDAEDVK
jgi:enoyl-CoA hydratase/carnithine racemase